jgi:hypothetical protein
MWWAAVGCGLDLTAPIIWWAGEKWPPYERAIMWWAGAKWPPYGKNNVVGSRELLTLRKKLCGGQAGTAHQN